MGRPPSDARERALQAALAVVVRDGAGSLTIDAVAKEAQMSKGGLLHHFATKDALIRALVEQTVLAWEAAVEVRADADTQPVGRYTRAFMRALAEPAIAELGRGLLAAVALKGELLEPLRAAFLRCQKRIAGDGLELATAYNCILVSDSLWFIAMFDLPRPPAEALEALMARLEASTRS